MTTQVDIPAQGDNPERPAINALTSVIFKITDTKLLCTSCYAFNSRW